mgnify:CR=1 FL=1
MLLFGIYFKLIKMSESQILNTIKGTADVTATKQATVYFLSLVITLYSVFTGCHITIDSEP